MYTLKRSKRVYKSRWMEVYEDSVIDKENGILGMFNRINVDDAAVVVPEFEDGSLLMVENYRHGVSTTLLELPGGFIKENEKPSNTARRELQEETGYTCNNLEQINWFYTWPGRATQRNFVYVAKGLKKMTTMKNSGKKNLENFEYIKVCKASREQIIRKLKNGKIKSAVTISALLYGYLV
jgi:ADP-ribose pyrophosphatase